MKAVVMVVEPQPQRKLCEMHGAMFEGYGKPLKLLLPDELDTECDECILSQSTLDRGSFTTS